MSTTIARAVENCGNIPDHNTQCGLAAGDFLAATTQLAAVTADTTRACGTKIGAHTPETTNLGNCAIDVNDATHSIFEAASALKDVKDSCDDDEDCAMNALSVMSALSAMGGAISSGFDNCKAADKNPATGSHVAGCAGDVLRAFSALSDVAKSAIALSQACKVEDGQRARLYSMAANGSASSSTNLFVTTLIAVAGTVMGFAGGLRFKRKSASAGYEEASTDADTMMPL
jgi:hypothetical protein